MSFNILVTYWNVLCKKCLGEKEDFTMENRMLNMACLMALAVLLLFLALNAFTGLWHRNLLLLFIFACEVVVYYFSRFKKQYTRGLIINGLISYGALATNYYFNSGVNGPTLFLFFFTMHTLVSGTPDKTHALWLTLHVITVTAILTIELAMPSLIKYTYRDGIARMTDMVAIYIVAILFIFQLTRYLRAYYAEEKTLANEYALKLKAFFDSSEDSHLLLDRDFTIIYYNYKASAFISNVYKKDLVRGKSVFDYVSPSYVQQCRQNCMQALNGQAVREQRMFTYPRLGDIWWNISFMPVRDSNGDIIGLSFNTVNITEAKQQEQELQAKNQSLSNIADIQSNYLNKPVLLITGLMKNIKNNKAGADNYLALMEKATIGLDEHICKIVAQTKTAEGQS